MKFKRLVAETDKAYLFRRENGKESWIPKSVCKLVSPKSVYDRNGEMNTCSFDVVIAPFKFEEITGRIPQPLDTPSRFNREARPEDMVEGVSLHEPLLGMLPHQRECVEKFLRQNKAALFMDMGTGKTLAACCLAESWRSSGLVNSVIVVCPVSLKENWRIKYGQYYDRAPELIVGSESISFSSVVDRLDLSDFDMSRTCVIVDESHYFKNADAIRTNSLFQLLESAAFKLILTGTPITKTAADLYTQMGLLDFGILGYRTFAEFEKSHLLYDEYGRVVGYTNIETVATNASPFVYHIDKSECLALPEKQETVLSFRMTDEQCKSYRLVEKCRESLVETSANSKFYLALTTYMQMIATGFLPDLSRLQEGAINCEINESSLGALINTPRIDVLKNILESHRDEQFVVFYQFNAEKNILENNFQKARFIDGTTKISDRQKIVNKFQSGVFRILACQIRVGGVGFDLQNCRNAVFYSSSWSLSDRLQAEARVYRHGQKNVTRIYDIVAEGTIEPRILERLKMRLDIKAAFETELAIEKT